MLQPLSKTDSRSPNSQVCRHFAQKSRTLLEEVPTLTLRHGFYGTNQVFARSSLTTVKPEQVHGYRTIETLRKGGYSDTSRLHKILARNGNACRRFSDTSIAVFPFEIPNVTEWRCTVLMDWRTRTPKSTSNTKSIRGLSDSGPESFWKGPLADTLMSSSLWRRKVEGVNGSIKAPLQMALTDQEYFYTQ